MNPNNQGSLDLLFKPKNVAINEAKDNYIILLVVLSSMDLILTSFI